jgi:hypothetical protein
MYFNAGLFVGLKRDSLEHRPSVRRAKPMTREILAKINHFILSGSRTLRQWRTAWRVNLAFFCLLRWDDVCRLEVRMILTLLCVRA